MTSLKLGQYVANKRERIWTAPHIVAKSFPLWQAVVMRRYGSLININLSGSSVPTLVQGIINQELNLKKNWK